MESPYVLEGEEILREGESRVFAIIWDDFTTVSTGGVEAYINGSSAGVFSGSSAAAGNTLTLPKFTVPAGSGGTSIVIEAGVTVDGQAYKTGIVCRILKPGAER